MKSIELLAPVGDFKCLMAAVQNGADAVYLGSNSFNARNSASNFDLEELKKAIDYAHLRGVSVHLTLNTLIKNNELEEAILLADHAYEAGIDALIVQDLGLATYLIHNYPDLPIHASTQMTVHNLEGVLALEKMGFQRVVLSRELSLEEIHYITSHCDVEIEAFMHGALCISYSGQCLFSSMIGGRSGNRGKCAQSCRLPYTLLENSSVLDRGYLLSPKDLCSLEVLPDFIASGVTSFKIEGRMKTPEYVAVVTRIYRKYIDKVLAGVPYEMDPQDKRDLLQVFNRGGFSTGHLLSDANKELIFKKKPNNMGIYIGSISHFSPSKGHITVDLADSISIGDRITIEKKLDPSISSTYTISELMIQNKNKVECTAGQKVTLGRMKGNIEPGDKLYKIFNTNLYSTVKDSFSGKEQKKIPLTASITLALGKPVVLTIHSGSHQIEVISDSYPEEAISSPFTEERVIQQLSKTGNTPFVFSKIKVHLQDNLYLPSIRILNELRRTGLSEIEAAITSSFHRSSHSVIFPNTVSKRNEEKKKVCVLLKILNLENDYSKMQNIDSLYIPLKYFASKKYRSLLQELCSRFSTYIYMPNIIRDNYKNLFKNDVDIALPNYSIKGFVISNLSNLEILKDYLADYEIIGNYTLNIFNSFTIEQLKKLGLQQITLSPELTKNHIIELSNTSVLPTELLVYGNIPLMSMNYCLLGKSNKCYPECKTYCTRNNRYYLKDRLGLEFEIIPDNIQTITTIYNSKITSIEHSDIPVSSVRIDILHESPEEINQIIKMVHTSKKLEGKQYTNGNLYRDV